MAQWGTQMATIRSRGSKFHVQVRKIGYPTVTKTQMSEIMRQMVSNNVVPKAQRYLYENEEMLVSHSVMNFPDGTTEAILRFDLLKDGKIIKSETGATLISE